MSTATKNDAPAATQDVTGQEQPNAESLEKALMAELGRGVKKVAPEKAAGYVRVFKGDKAVAWIHRRKDGIRVDARIKVDDLPTQLRSKIVEASGSFGVRVPVKSTDDLPVAVEAVKKAVELATK